MCLELAQDFCIGLEYFKQNLPSRLNPTLELLVNITQETPLSPWEDIGLLSQDLLGDKTALLGTTFCPVFGLTQPAQVADSCGNVLVMCFALPWLSHLSVSGTGVAAGGDLRPWRGLKFSHLETPKRRTWDPKVALQTSTLNRVSEDQFPAPRVWLASAIYQGKARVSALWSPLLCIK